MGKRSTRPERGLTHFPPRAPPPRTTTPGRQRGRVLQGGAGASWSRERARWARAACARSLARVRGGVAVSVCGARFNGGAVPHSAPLPGQVPGPNSWPSDPLLPAAPPMYSGGDCSRPGPFLRPSPSPSRPQSLASSPPGVVREVAGGCCGGISLPSRALWEPAGRGTPVAGNRGNRDSD